MAILDKIRCPICGGMGVQLRNKPPHYTAKTIACKHCDAELDSGHFTEESTGVEDIIREALEERKGDPEGIHLSRKPTRRAN